MIEKPKKNFFKKAWKYLTGKKTLIGAAVMLAAKGGTLFFPDLLDEKVYEFLAELGAGIAALGFSHKAVSNTKVNDAIRNAQRYAKKKF